MAVTDADVIADAVATCDDILRMVAAVRAEKPRDPLRRLEDVVLELRTMVASASHEGHAAL